MEEARKTQRSALASVFCHDRGLTPVETVVDPKFNGIEVLLDAHRSAEAAKSSPVRAREEQVAIAESVEIVFELGGPIVPEHPLEPCAYRPASAGLRGVVRTRRWGQAVNVLIGNGL